MTLVVILSRRSIFHPKAGGADRYVHEIFRRLTGRYDITVIAEGGKGSPPIEEVDGIRYVNVPGPMSRFLTVLRYIVQYGKESDVLIDHADVAIPWVSPLLPHKIPTITIVHQLLKEVYYYELRRPWADLGCLAERLLYRVYSNSQIVTPSKSTAYELVDLGIPEQNITVISPAPPPTPQPVGPAFNERTNTVSCVSRLVRYKGVQFALGAFRHVVMRNPTVILKIAGSGQYEQELRRMTKRYGLSDNVEFLGSVTEETKFRLLSESRVTAAPSIREGFGISVLEANSFGTPVVGWNVPGLRDSIINNTTGLLAPFPDEGAFAKALLTLLTDNATWHRLSQNALRWARAHSWDQAAANFGKVIESLVVGDARES